MQNWRKTATIGKQGNRTCNEWKEKKDKNEENWGLIVLLVELDGGEVVVVTSHQYIGNKTRETERRIFMKWNFSIWLPGHSPKVAHTHTISKWFCVFQVIHNELSLGVCVGGGMCSDSRICILVSTHRKKGSKTHRKWKGRMQIDKKQIEQKRSQVIDFKPKMKLWAVREKERKDSRVCNEAAVARIHYSRQETNGKEFTIFDRLWVVKKLRMAIGTMEIKI